MLTLLVCPKVVNLKHVKLLMVGVHIQLQPFQIMMHLYKNQKEKVLTMLPSNCHTHRGSSKYASETPYKL